MTIETTRLYGAGRLAAGILSLTLLAGCEVTNPGPVQDEFVALPAAQQGLVNGAARSITELVGSGAYTRDLLAREIFPGGQTGYSGHDVTVQAGYVVPGSFGGYWGDAQQARFIAETAIKRFAEAGAPDDLMYQAHLWAGYAYRHLGGWWCHAVVASTDPDDPAPGTFEEGTDTYFERAVANFTAALDYAATDQERYAALAGRAQASVGLEDWTNAAADAAEVPDDFVFQALMNEQDDDEYNWLAESTSGDFRSFSVMHTFFDDYYTETGDPRTPWDLDPEYPFTVGGLQGYGNVPYKRQRKYTSLADPINLASGWEMRLIEAEALLVAGQWQQAMVLINHVRTRNISDTTSEPLEPRVAANPVEAWTWLKRERYIELWLEGRRLYDELRWAANDTPGPVYVPDWDGLSALFTQYERSFCFDIPDSERERNPNVPETSS